MKEVKKNEGKKNKRAIKRPDLLEMGGKSVRTLLHVRHFPDLPCGKITIEGSSTLKHCTHTATKKSPRIKMGWKKRGKNIKNRIISASAKKGRRKKETANKIPDLVERGVERVYLLDSIIVTFPTCHLERSPLKAVAPANTAPHTEKSKG